MKSVVPYFVVSLIFLLALVFMIYMYFREKATRIHPKDCPVISYSYGVNPGRTSEILSDRKCGGDCVFDANSLTEAVNRCNGQSDICKSFAYQGSRMWYIDPKAKTTPNSNTNIYVRQTQS